MSYRSDSTDTDDETEYSAPELWKGGMMGEEYVEAFHWSS